MTSKKILVLAAFAVLVCANEVEEVEQKKRGASKTTLNAIPTGGQKTDYTYSIYSQSPSQQSQPATYQSQPATYQSQPSQTYQTQPSPSYQSQIPNSFYPTQSGSSQYYQPVNQPQESPVYPPQPQLSLIPPPSSSQFLPLNFVPNPGYQAKYQILQPKSQSGNIQFALVPSQSFLQGQPFVYPQSLFGNTHSHNLNQNTILNPISPQGHFAQNYQLPLGQNFGHPSAMFVLSQPNPSIYNNLLYPSSGPSLYNYYQPQAGSYQPQSNPQKYNLYYSGASANNQSPSTNDYDKLQGVISQNAPKEDNEISVHNSDYITPAESISNYKNSYVSSRSAYKN